MMKIRGPQKKVLILTSLGVIACGIFFMTLQKKFAPEISSPKIAKERDEPIEEKMEDPEKGAHKGRKLIPTLPGAFYFGDKGKWSLPLNQPKWIPGASSNMKDLDPIAGIYQEKVAFALPWWVLKNYHVANIEVEGRPILITFCEKCSSASAFNPVIQGKPHHFRMVGLYNGSHIISDYETDSIWGPFSGEALDGPLKGTQLERLRLVQCLWKEWLEIHPSSFVVEASDELRKGHGSDQFPGKKQGPKDGFLRLLVKPIDQRLPSNQMVLGVSVAGKTKAYSLHDLDQLSVVNDVIGNEEIVIFHESKTLLTSAFSPKVKDEVLLFELGKDGRIMDQKHQSHWNLDGEATDGPLKNQSLSYVNSGLEEWYIWAAYHPGTELFQINAKKLASIQ